MHTFESFSPAGQLCLTFYGNIVDLLRRSPDDEGTIVFPLTRRASIKDIVEGLGVPHAEVGKLVLDGQEKTFEKIAEDGEHYEIHPLSPNILPTVATILRPQPLDYCIFLVDINVGRLAGLLRMSGCDAEVVAPGSTNHDTVRSAVDQGRILLTRNRDLLKQRRLVFGHLVRSQDPYEQLREIINLYCLQDQLRPFSRCIVCNGLLVNVEKMTIAERLLPLTQKYYDCFNQCTGCGKIYWHGSHLDTMTAKLAKTLDI